MSPGEYQELVEFLARQFARMDRRFDEHDKRFDEHDKRFADIDARFERQREETRSLVLVTAESLRDGIRLVAEGVTSNRQLIEEVRSDVRAMRSDMEHRDTLFSARLEDHEGRIRRLE